jgi:hypothetical protein
MEKKQEDKEREERIYDDIIVDAYGDEEQALGWQTYLHDTLQFPFEAKCIKALATSPLLKNEKVKVLGMGDMEPCYHAMFVEIAWKDRLFRVPLEQLLPVDADEETVEAVEDWHYWVEKG